MIGMRPPLSVEPGCATTFMRLVRTARLPDERASHGGLSAAAVKTRPPVSHNECDGDNAQPGINGGATAAVPDDPAGGGVRQGDRKPWG